MQVLIGYTRSPYFFTGLLLFGAFAMASDASMLFSEFFWGDQRENRYEGRLPNSLLTLNYPYTLMRGNVLEQPVEASDVPFFWHAHKSDGRLIQKILSTCYNVESVELDTLEGIQKAREVNLAARKEEKFAITSPFLPEAIQVFTPEHLGRGVCFFRHPLDYDLYDTLPTYEDAPDNFMVRYLLGGFKGPVGFKELGDAKQIVRDICVVSTIDRVPASFERAMEFLGWSSNEDGSSSSSESSCVKGLVDAENPRERYLDHNTPEWKKFYEENKMDCQLYEFAQTAWRAQIQTIIPLTLQKKRAGGTQQEPEDEEE